MRAAVIIPARYASTRLPGKPLLRETGKFLIQHVYEQASRARRADAVVVATDDARIAEAVASFGGRAVMTSPDHASGTDRVAEAAAGLDAPVVVNVQGDEPEIDPAVIDGLVDAVEGGALMATAAVRVASPEAYASPAVVKVVTDADGWALYFSRAPIPAGRDAPPDGFLKHLGIYAYTRDFLRQVTAMPPSPLEQLEKLEQLRVLEAGHRIKVLPVDHDAAGIDTPEEYRAFVARLGAR
jgi:3-deoxy-manno-octulosonate cytidylyltransferase (CMP-KDO synthetase)